MLPAGNATEEVLTELAKFVEPGDIIVDGGNAYYKDTQRRFETFAMNNVLYLGIGVSGGVKARENGYSLMVGGSEDAYKKLTEALDTLTRPNAKYEYFGQGGAGHFVKMVHNGIEYGMMQAIGEGFGVLDRAGYDVDLGKVAHTWQKGTIVSGFLMDCIADALKKNPELEGLSGAIGHSGEGEWTVEAGKEEDVPIEVIEKSLEFRKKSHIEKEISESVAAKMVNALRHEFGGHEVKKK
jgi:6-phosphogluconate dehydrogenase